MRDHGWEVQGVEHSEEAVTFCREQRGLKVAVGDLTERPDDGTRFDLITMWASLPHFPEPLQVMRRASQLLSEGGSVVLCVANIDSWAFKMGQGAWGHLDQPRHYCMFTPKTLSKLLVDSGLKPREIHYDDSLWQSQFAVRPIVAIQDWLPTGDRAGAKVTRKMSHYITRALTSPIEMLARLCGQGGVVVARATRE